MDTETMCRRLWSGQGAHFAQNVFHCAKKPFRLGFRPRPQREVYDTPHPSLTYVRASCPIHTADADATKLFWASSTCLGCSKWTNLLNIFRSPYVGAYGYWDHVSTSVVRRGGALRRFCPREQETLVTPLIEPRPCVVLQAVCIGPMFAAFRGTPVRPPLNTPLTFMLAWISNKLVRFHVKIPRGFSENGKKTLWDYFFAAHCMYTKHSCWLVHVLCYVDWWRMVEQCTRLARRELLLLSLLHYTVLPHHVSTSQVNLLSSVYSLLPYLDALSSAWLFVYTSQHVFMKYCRRINHYTQYAVAYDKYGILFLSSRKYTTTYLWILTFVIEDSIKDNWRPVSCHM